MAVHSLINSTPCFSAPGFRRIKVLTDFEEKVFGGRKLKLDTSKENNIMTNDLFNGLKEGANFRTNHKYMIMELRGENKMEHVTTLIGGGIRKNTNELRFRDSAQTTDEYLVKNLEDILEAITMEKIDPLGCYLKITVE